ncbi:Pol polyprotein [Elysia marginata]|uniref:Pol polyprotein n=1 Tax=Elysia marginata TaxID=1093978 RepID=A0AAV4FS76_9GAST|nr:Pol polyprotein [Elysia marginata]
MLTEPQVLAYFDLNKETIVSADASQFGLGAVLLQQHKEGLKPVAYCSRTLTKTETRYAQIEKELLAATWACERFEKYLVSMEQFALYTDHKPLVPLINNKHLKESPLGCQRMLMRLMRFRVTATYVPEKNMVVADTLSRCPRKLLEEDDELQQNVKAFVEAWPVSDKKLEQIKQLTQEDVALSTALSYTRDGCPEHRENVKLAPLGLYTFRNELSEVDGLLVYGDRIVIPYKMRKETLEKIYEGHLGITKCKERARASVWWPQINQEIKYRVARCQHCIEKKPTQRKEPLLTSEVPDRPFQKVGTCIDICELKKNQYLVQEDYCSRYLEIMYLPSSSSHTVICKLKCCFARYGILESVVSDNARQFTSLEFEQFSREWNFKHITSSARFPQSNGFAERAVKTAKEILNQDDIFLAILACTSTPLTQLGPGDPVQVKTDDEKHWKTQARVLQKVAPRSYIVRTDLKGDLRRNRRHLKKIPESNYRHMDQDDNLDLEPDQESPPAAPVGLWTSSVAGTPLSKSAREKDFSSPSPTPTTPQPRRVVTPRRGTIQDPSPDPRPTAQLKPPSSSPTAQLISKTSTATPQPAQHIQLRRSMRQAKPPLRLISE